MSLNSAENGGAGSSEFEEVTKRLFHEILMARQRVYAAAAPTPLQQLEQNPFGAELWLKREDLSPIHAYKWRGAYNRMAVLTEEERARGVVTASAGNHAQGVALAARKLGTRAKIYMPRSTPRMKQVAVKHHGEDAVEIILHGDTFDAAANEARRVVEETGAPYIAPYDDPLVMAGQGTLADEVVMAGIGALDAAFLQIGGGGMAAGVACWLRHYYPGIRLIGVEGVGQASMKAAFAAGEPVDLSEVDLFCDGTAVRRAGTQTFPILRELLDDIITVTNEEVCAAVQLLWEQQRAIPEPSGAMGLAGFMQQHDAAPDDWAGKQVLAIVCGANLDFTRLAWIARHAGIGAHRRRYFRCEIGEKSGSMLDLLDAMRDGVKTNASAGVNIFEFQYGKTDPERAWPVIGFEASPPEMELLQKRLTQLGISYTDVTSEEDVEFRIIHYSPELFSNPFFIRFDFPERAGALSDFLIKIKDKKANIVYFNYAESGERIGRALLGFEFATPDERDAFQHFLTDNNYRWQQISEAALKRIL